MLWCSGGCQDVKVRLRISSDTLSICWKVMFPSSVPTLEDFKIYLFMKISLHKILFRYGFLLLKNVASEDPLNVAISVLQKLNIRPEMYQVGYTKLFFRTGQAKISSKLFLLFTSLLYAFDWIPLLYVDCISLQCIMVWWVLPRLTSVNKEHFHNKFNLTTVFRW